MRLKAACVTRSDLAGAVWQRFLPLLAIGVLLLALTACSSDDDEYAPSLDDANQTGEELVNEYITLLQNKDADGLEDFISDAFMIQRADGSFDTKEHYVQDIPDVGDFTITDVTARQAGDSLVVRWYLTVNEVINGSAYSAQPAPRLSTFVWNDSDWQLFSHANFNAPSNNPPASPTQ